MYKYNNTFPKQHMKKSTVLHLTSPLSPVHLSLSLFLFQSAPFVCLYLCLSCLFQPVLFCLHLQLCLCQPVPFCLSLFSLLVLICPPFSCLYLFVMPLSICPSVSLALLVYFNPSLLYVCLFYFSHFCLFISPVFCIIFP